MFPDAEGQNSLHARMQLLATPVGEKGVKEGDAGANTSASARKKTKKRGRGTGEDPTSADVSGAEHAMFVQVFQQSREDLT